MNTLNARIENAVKEKNNSSSSSSTWYFTTKGHVDSHNLPEGPEMSPGRLGKFRLGAEREDIETERESTAKD